MKTIVRLQAPLRSAPKQALLASVLALTTAATHAMGLNGIFELALKNDSTYLGAVADNRAAQEFVPQAESQRLPNVSLTGSADGVKRLRTRRSLRSLGNTERADFFFSGDLSLQVSQPIYRKNIVIEIDQADSRTQQANADFAFALQDLIVRVAESYFGVLAAIDSLDFARAEQDAISQQLTQSQQRFEVGLIAVTDVEEARAGFDLAVARVIAAQNNLDSTFESLREIIGRYIRSLDPLGDNVPLVVPEPNDIDSWTQTALEQNWQLEATRLQVATARDEIRRIETGHLPTLDLVGSSAFNVIRGAGTSSNDTWDNSIGFRLNLPLYQGGLVLSRTRESQHRHQSALEAHERQRRATQRLTRGAFRGVLSGISQVKALGQAVRSAESALEAIEAGFQVGTRTSVDVLNAQRELFGASRDFSGARYDYILNILRLKQASGTLSPRDLKEVDAWLNSG
ncbi:MAG: TolC family outer membrane protein [Gammaproteobacteria bacterium]|nr:TolC family outer membrane protein [Gammaproteobacteria bacterium]